MFWAPLISGSTTEEKDLIQQESAAAGKSRLPHTHQEEQDPGTEPVIAGVPYTPLNIDPPGTGSPFDALKHPKSLVARLNRVPHHGMPFGWDEKALKKIPRSLIAKISPEAFAALPASIRSARTPQTLAKYPSAPAAAPARPAVSRLTRRNQLLSSNAEQEAETSDSSTLLQPTQGVEVRPARPILPAMSRFGLRHGHEFSPTYDMASSSEDEAAFQETATPEDEIALHRPATLTSEAASQQPATAGDEAASQQPATPAPRRALVDYSDSDSEAAREPEAAAQDEETAQGESTEPSGKSRLPTTENLQPRRQRSSIEKKQKAISNLRGLPVAEVTGEHQSFHADDDIDPDKMEEDDDSEETLQLRLAAHEANVAAAETRLRLKRLRKRKATSQDEPLEDIPQSSADPLSPSIHTPRSNRTRRVTADRSMVRDLGEDPTSPILPEGHKRLRRSSGRSTDDSPKHAGLSITNPSYHTPGYVPRSGSKPAYIQKSGIGHGGGKSRSPKRVCIHCRIKNVKCDGIHPSCTPCGNYGVACSFESEDEQKTGEQEDVADEQPDAVDEQPDTTDEQLDDVDEQPAPAKKQPASAKGQGGDPDMGYVQGGRILRFDGALDGVDDSGPTSQSPDKMDHRPDFDDGGRQLIAPPLGPAKDFAERFSYRSSTDHLSLQINTIIPLQFHPKPVFLQMPGFPKKTRLRTAHAYNEICLPQEETFMTRPSVRIVVPDHLKNLLVDDWENVTKSLLVVPLPSKAPVNFIIDSYFDEEKGKRRLGSAEADVLEEFVAGMKVYFDKAIGKTLLYKFERPQWAEVCESAKPLLLLADPT